MAISLASLTGANSATDATSYNTGTVALTAGRMYVVCVQGRKTSGTVDTPTLSGHGETWDQIRTDTYNGGLGRNTIFRCIASDSSGAAAIAIDFGGVTQHGCAWEVIEVTGSFATGTNGAAAVGDTDFTSGTAAGASGPTLTLQDANSVNLTAVSHAANEATGPDSDFAELGDRAGSGPASAMETQWATNQATCNASTWATSSAYGITSVEVREAAAGGVEYTQNPTGDLTSAGALTKGPTQIKGGTLSLAGALGNAATSAAASIVVRRRSHSGLVMR